MVGGGQAWLQWLVTRCWNRVPSTVTAGRGDAGRPACRQLSLPFPRGQVRLRGRGLRGMKCPLSPSRLTEKQGPERKRIRKEPVTRKAGLLFGMGLSGIRAGYPLSERQQVALLMQMTAEESANSPGEPGGPGLGGPSPTGSTANLRHPLWACSGHDTKAPLPVDSVSEGDAHLGLENQRQSEQEERAWGDPPAPGSHPGGCPAHQGAHQRGGRRQCQGLCG